jgi:hypothetical protein
VAARTNPVHVIAAALGNAQERCCIDRVLDGCERREEKRTGSFAPGCGAAVAVEASVGN